MAIDPHNRKKNKKTAVPQEHRSSFYRTADRSLTLMTCDRRIVMLRLFLSAVSVRTDSGNARIDWTTAFNLPQR
jgi:hypothetical protein